MTPSKCPPNTAQPKIPNPMALGFARDRGRVHTVLKRREKRLLPFWGAEYAAPWGCSATASGDDEAGALGEPGQ